MTYPTPLPSWVPRSVIDTIGTMRVLRVLPRGRAYRD